MAAVDPETNEFLPRAAPFGCTIALTERFLRELRAKHDVADALFLVDGAPWLQAARHRDSLRLQHETHGARNAVERVSKEIKRGTDQFAIISVVPRRNPPNRGRRRSRSPEISYSERSHNAVADPSARYLC